MHLRLMKCILWENEKREMVKIDKKSLSLKTEKKKMEKIDKELFSRNWERLIKGREKGKQKW